MSDKPTVRTQPVQDGRPKGRLVSLDAYRGFTMLAMASGGFCLTPLARHFPDSDFWSFVGHHATHVSWRGCAAWDLILPAFMFMVGVSMAYSCASRKAKGQSYRRMLLHAIWRSLVLILLGVFLRSNGRPETYWTVVDVVSQIGLGYVFLFLLWGRKVKVQLGVIAAILVGYWALFAFWPWSEAELSGGIAAHWNKGTHPGRLFDEWLLTLFPSFQHFHGDYPALNFIPSLATMAIGLLAGELLRSDRSPWRKVGFLTAAGLGGLAFGFLLDHFDICPMVKRIWTPSWVLFSGGWVLLSLTALYVVIDVWRFRAWAFPAVVVGMNSLATYIMACLIRGWISQTLRTHLGNDVFHVFGDLYAPTVHSGAVLLVMWLICFWMYRQRIFLRV